MQLLLTDSLRRAERLYGRNQAAICGEVRLTYAEFGARCRALAAALQRTGVGRGDRVATLLGNCHRYLEAYTAIPMLGAVIVPLNTRHAATEQRASSSRTATHACSSPTRPTEVERQRLKRV
jgi:acyl-CoA synthetase (AMP-forming)/AMP-acid ligase II